MAVTRGKFEIGDWVETGHFVTFPKVYIEREHEIRRVLRRNQGPICGQIVGVAVRQEGVIDYGGPESDPEGFQAENQHDLWMIRLGMKNRPVLALEPDIHHTDEPSVGLPWLHITPVPWSKADREKLSKESQGWPRDAKGRWLKEKL